MARLKASTALAVLGGLVMAKVLTSKRKSSGSSGASPIGGQLDLSAISGLAQFSRHPERLRRVVWLLQVWTQDARLTADDAAVLLTWAYLESGFLLNARSGAGTPDEAVGHSWSMFQISLETAQGLGIDIRELLVEAVNGVFREEDIERATRANARAALKLVFARHSFTQGEGFLEWLRERYHGEPAQIARALFIRASGGPARGWDYEYTENLSPLMQVAPNERPGSGGYIHFQIARRLAVWPLFRRALGLQAIDPPADLKVPVALPPGEHP